MMETECSCKGLTVQLYDVPRASAIMKTIDVLSDNCHLPALRLQSLFQLCQGL